MKVALVILMKDMEISIEKCDDLIPPLAEKTIGKLKVAVYAWHHCNKIEATLLNLRNHIRVCHRRFTTLSLARTESLWVGITTTITRTMTLLEIHLEPTSNAERKPLLTEEPNINFLTEQFRRNKSLIHRTLLYVDVQAPKIAAIGGLDSGYGLEFVSYPAGHSNQPRKSAFGNPFKLILAYRKGEGSFYLFGPPSFTFYELWYLEELPKSWIVSPCLLRQLYV